MVRRMNRLIALGLIETVGYSTAVSAADAAVKAANVEIIGMEKVIGVGGYVSVTIHFSGDVAAVQSAVDAGREKAEMIGSVISAEVIARAHSDVQESLLSHFTLKDVEDAPKETPKEIKPKTASKQPVTKKKEETKKQETKKASDTKKDKK